MHFYFVFHTSCFACWVLKYCFLQSLQRLWSVIFGCYHYCSTDMKIFLTRNPNKKLERWGRYPCLKELSVWVYVKKQKDHLFALLMRCMGSAFLLHCYIFQADYLEWWPTTKKIPQDTWMPMCLCQVLCMWTACMNNNNKGTDYLCSYHFSFF